MDWTFAENKIFENALGELGLDCPNLFQEIASIIPGKTTEQIQVHYNELVRDIEMIESGCLDEDLDRGSTDSTPKVTNAQSSNGPPRVQRKSPIPWTANEHEAFLGGLEKYGKGDWRSISRFCVQTKSPRQVASHAQKHFDKLKRLTQRQEAQAQVQAQVQAQSNASSNIPTPSNVHVNRKRQHINDAAPSSSATINKP